MAYKLFCNVCRCTFEILVKAPCAVHVSNNQYALIILSIDHISYEFSRVFYLDIDFSCNICNWTLNSLDEFQYKVQVAQVCFHPSSRPYLIRILEFFDINVHIIFVNWH